MPSLYRFPSQGWAVVPLRTSQSGGRHPAPCEADEPSSLSCTAGILLPDTALPSVAPSPLTPALAGIRRAEKGVLLLGVGLVNAASRRSVSKNACFADPIDKR